MKRVLLILLVWLWVGVSVVGVIIALDKLVYFGGFLGWLRMLIAC